MAPPTFAAVARTPFIVAEDLSCMARNFGSLGLVGLLIVIGIILFLFPEPATSGLGITLIVLALIVWAVSELL